MRMISNEIVLGDIIFMTHKSKLLKAIIVMLSVCLTCGCSLSSDENVVSIKNHAGEINEKLESCLKEEDADGLKTLFCQKLLMLVSKYPNVRL